MSGPTSGMTSPALTLRLLGVGAMRSSRYAPAGLPLTCGDARVMFDGGPGAEPGGRLNAWPVTDERRELRATLRRLARERGLEPVIASFHTSDVAVEPCPVSHTTHPTVGYLIRSGSRRVVWAPEFRTFPEWAADVDLL